MKKFFDVQEQKYLDFDEKDIKSYFDSGIKIKNKYCRVLFDKIENAYYIFNIAKTKSEIENIKLDPENEYVIKWSFNTTYYNDTYETRKTHPFPDTYKLNVGDKCVVGNWTNCSIIAKDNRGYYYVKHYPATWEIKKNPEIADIPHYEARHWIDVFPYIENATSLEFEQSNVSYSNMCLDSILINYFKFGIDLNPEYQRGDVWTEEQKVKLIDSIYRDINIGSIVLVEKKWFNNNHEVTSEMYEILDGKQRLTAIIDYFSSKFKYRGKYFYELSDCNRSEFGNQQILVGTLRLNKKDDEYNRKKVIEQFIRLNEGGTSMDKAIIEKAKEMINE